MRDLTESLGSPGVHTALWQTLFRGSGLHFPNVSLQEKLQLHQLRSGISDFVFFLRLLAGEQERRQFLVHGAL